MFLKNNKNNGAKIRENVAKTHNNRAERKTTVESRIYPHRYCDRYTAGKRKKQQSRDPNAAL